MKILICAPTIYEKRLKEFQKNKNGFAIMVNDIAQSLSEFDEVYVLTHAIVKQKYVDKVQFVNHSLVDVLKGLSLNNMIEGLSNAVGFSASVSRKLRYIYYSIEKGQIETTIKKINPDFVSIHGIGYATKPYIDICKRLRVRYSVTMHGLIGLDSSVRSLQQDKDLERKFFVESEKKNVPVTVISSGIKRRAISAYGLKNGENIQVILNGTNLFNVDAETEVIRDKYNVSEDKKIAICIGNITPNKNQIQIVRMFEKLPSEIKDKLVILFLGKEVDGGCIREEINCRGLQDKMILCGFIPREVLPLYYKAASINIFPSLNDGFGLPIIEGYSFGVPTVTFADLDAVEDIFDEKAVVLSHSRSDEALARAVEQALCMEWDSAYIRKLSTRYTLKKMAENYHNFFERNL